MTDILSLGDNRHVAISPNRIRFFIASGERVRAIAQEEGGKNNLLPRRVEHNGRAISLGIMPSYDCNLRCVYCYSRGGEQRASLEYSIAERALSSIIQTDGDEPIEHIALYFVGGGEPFLNFSTMQKIIDFCQSRVTSVQPIIVSNGLFGKKQREWIVATNAAIRISYDGVAHEEQRPSAKGSATSDIVENNIRYLVEANCPITVQSTITASSVDRMGDTVVRLAGLGVKYIKLEPTHCSVLSRAENCHVPSVASYASAFVDTVKMVRKNCWAIKLDNSVISRPTTGYYCGAANGSNLTLTPEGNLTACLEVSRLDEPFSDEMIVGQVSGKCGFELNEKKRQKLSRLHVREYEQCSGCNLRLLCNGGCPIQGGWERGVLGQPSEYVCKLNKTLIPELLSLVFEDAKYLDILFDGHEVFGNC